MKRLFVLSLLLCTIVGSSSAVDVRWALNNLPDAYYQDFQDGMAVFRDKKTYLYGAIDTKGKVVIPATYKRMSSFAGGVSLVETKQGKGFINKNGQFLLQPDTLLVIKEIHQTDKYGNVEYEYAELFELTNKVTNEKGYWYKNRLVLPMSAQRDYTIHFPFIVWKEIGDTYTHILNVKTGEIIQGSIEKKGILQLITIPTSTGNITRLYNDEIELKNIETSTQGVRLCKDGEKSSSYSLVNSSGDTLLFATEGWAIAYPIWQNDKVLASKFKLNGADSEYSFRLYDGKGDICFEKNFAHCPEFGYGQIAGSGVLISFFNDDFGLERSELYNFKGECILSGKSFIKHLYGAWYQDFGSQGKLINISSKHTYPCRNIRSISDDMIIGDDYKENFFIINLQTGKYTKLPFNNITSVSKYREGLAIVETRVGNDWQKVAIDKNANIVLRDCKDYKLYSGSSEGVIAVYNYGASFIYNPLFQNAPIYGKEEHNQWLYDEGVNLYNQKKYAQAKDKFYDVMINDPQNVNSINYYGCCLERLGYYDSAIDAFLTILRIDPNNKLAIDNIEVCKQNKSTAEQKEQYSYNNAMTWFDGLTQFLNVLGDAFSQYAEYTNDMNTSRSAGYNYQNNSSGSSNRQSGSDNISKSRDARTYSDLESQLIKMNTYYNTYNDNQRRSIQSQMRSIRTKWESRGFRMFHSSWEDWDGHKR